MTATGTRAGSPLHTGDPRFGAPREVDVLIPTRDRAAELAVTLAGLAAQEGVPDFGVAVSDQSEGDPAWATPAVAAAVRILRHRGRPVLLERHLPARGLAEQRAFLLGLSQARYVLSLDDDVWLEPGTCPAGRRDRRLGCGFVGSAVHGLSYVDDLRPPPHGCTRSGPARRCRSGCARAPGSGSGRGCTRPRTCCT